MFMPHTYDSSLQPWEYHPAAAGTYKVGQALKIAGGKVAATGAALTTTPPYICMAETTVEDGEALPVLRTKHDIVFETTLSAAAESAAIGSKLQVSADGLTVDAATAGSFEVVYLEGTAVGNVVRGRFQ